MALKAFFQNMALKNMAIWHLFWENMAFIFFKTWQRKQKGMAK
jgi:hypothetical protein